MQNCYFDFLIASLNLILERGRGGCSQGFGVTPRVMECFLGFWGNCENFSDLL